MVALVIGAVEVVVEVVDIVEEEGRYIFDSRPNVYFDPCCGCSIRPLLFTKERSVSLTNLLSRSSRILKISVQEVQVAIADQTRIVSLLRLSAASGATVRSDLFFFLLMVMSIIL